MKRSRKGDDGRFFFFSLRFPLSLFAFASLELFRCRGEREMNLCSSSLRRQQQQSGRAVAVERKRERERVCHRCLCFHPPLLLLLPLYLEPVHAQQARQDALLQARAEHDGVVGLVHGAR